MPGKIKFKDSKRRNMCVLTLLFDFPVSNLHIVVDI